MSLPKLTLHKKEVVGKPRYYPACNASKKLIQLMKTPLGGRKVFTENDVKIIKELGFNVTIKEARIIYE